MNRLEWCSSPYPGTCCDGRRARGSRAAAGLAGCLVRQVALGEEVPVELLDGCTLLWIVAVVLALGHASAHGDHGVILESQAERGDGRCGVEPEAVGLRYPLRWDAVAELDTPIPRKAQIAGSDLLAHPA